MGYTNVVQCQIASQNRRAPDSNGNVMDYLKKIVPKMFQVRVENVCSPAYLLAHKGVVDG
jgi:hypothetical protein